jgi:hypothetical protein
MILTFNPAAHNLQGFPLWKLTTAVVNSRNIIKAPLAYRFHIPANQQIAPGHSF